MSLWKNVLELNSEREIISGSNKELCDAIGRGSDLRIYTEFRHNEHIDPSSADDDLISEVSEFHETCLFEKSWSAGIMTMRQPVSLPDSFGPRSSMSFFLYNQDGRQAIARPYLDGISVGGVPGSSAVDPHIQMPKYREYTAWDTETNAPSSNFIYDFGRFRFHVCDNWQEVYSHDKNGSPVFGSLETLIEAFHEGSEIKAGITGLFEDLGDPDSQTNEWSELVHSRVRAGKARVHTPRHAADGSRQRRLRDQGSALGYDTFHSRMIDHEVFIQTGWGYYYNDNKVFIAETHPLVKVKPAIPLSYESEGWNFGWVILRTDGACVERIYNPYTLQDTDTNRRYGIRWFVR